jgi:uncharacterized membrane protein HdeD (DUF308 family)
MNSNPINQINHSAQWSMAASVAMILAGLLAIIVPAASGLFFAALVGWVLVFSGFMHFVYATQTHTGGAHKIISEMGLHGGSAWWEMGLGMLYLAIGIYVLTHLATALLTLTMALGIYLLIEGILEFVLSYHFQGVKGSGWLLFDGIISIILAAVIFRTWPQNAVWVPGTLVGISIFFSGIARLMLSSSVNRVTRVLPS